MQNATGIIRRKIQTQEIRKSQLRVWYARYHTVTGFRSGPEDTRAPHAYKSRVVLKHICHYTFYAVGSSGLESICFCPVVSGSRK